MELPGKALLINFGLTFIHALLVILTRLTAIATLFIQLINYIAAYITFTINSSGHSKVTYFNSAVFVKKNIAGLQVTVEHLAIMNVLCSLENVYQNGLDVNPLQSQTTFQKLQKITLTIFHNYVNTVKVIQILRHDNINELRNVFAVELLENCDFSEYSFAVLSIVEYVAHLFYCYFFTSCQLDSHRYLPITTISNHLLQFVPFTNFPTIELILLHQGKNESFLRDCIFCSLLSLQGL